MAVIKVIKTKNYTVMSNAHLKDMRLSLKAIGLQSKILSLPPEWDYTVEGLAKICKDNITAVTNALNELIAAGYISRERVRDERGKFIDIEYTVYEVPQNKEDAHKGKNPIVDNPIMDSPIMEEPIEDNPTMEGPIEENPMPENHHQSNTKYINNINNIKESKIDDHHPIPCNDATLPPDIAEATGYDILERHIRQLWPDELCPPDQKEALLREGRKLAKALFLIANSEDPLSDAAKQDRLLSTIVTRLPVDPVPVVSDPLKYMRTVLTNMRNERR